MIMRLSWDGTKGSFQFQDVTQFSSQCPLRPPPHTFFFDPLSQMLESYFWKSIITFQLMLQMARGWPPAACECRGRWVFVTNVMENPTYAHMLRPRITELRTGQEDACADAGQRFSCWFFFIWTVSFMQWLDFIIVSHYCWCMWYRIPTIIWYIWVSVLCISNEWIIDFDIIDISLLLCIKYQLLLFVMWFVLNNM